MTQDHSPRRGHGSHQHGMSIPENWAGPFDEHFWNERYSEKASIWSGDPNPHLVRVVEASDPGVALDVGSGEGGDAFWLARRGWRVTATDISTVALERASSAIASETAVADRIEWKQADVLAWTPPEGAYDLVSSQYSHFPSSEMIPFLRRLAAAVALDGTLLVVAHEANDDTPMGPEYFFPAEGIADLLPSSDWEVVEAGRLSHPTRHGRDEVLVARRVR